MTPCYFALDCIPTPDGGIRVVDVHGGVGGGMRMLAAAYGGPGPARARLHPYLQRLGELAAGKRILFVHDPFTARQPFPDDFFNWVERFSEYGPITDWVPDIQTESRGTWAATRTPDVEQMGVFLDPLASRLRLKLAYCSAARVDRAHPVRRGKREQGSGPQLLLSGYRERARGRPNSVILPPEEVGAIVFSGASERFPDDLKRQSWFPVVNPPLLDALLENKWLGPSLLAGTEAAALLPRWVPVGMGLRTASEVRDFAAGLQTVNGFPLAVISPSHENLLPGLRFVDRTGLRALLTRLPERRLPRAAAETLLRPRIAHSYEEISGYRGKLLDNLLRSQGAEVVDHGDGTFHYVAPYPFLESTVGILREYVEARPVRSRRTNKLHRGTLRVVMFDRRLVSAVYRLSQEPDDGTFRDLERSDAATFYEGAAPEEEAQLQRQLGPFVATLEERFAETVRTPADLERLRARWVLDQAV